jgi:8-oxo-dGTP pyrophosphatase MutT (NUDIX family)
VTFVDAVARLDAALRGELPGAAAHARLAPVPRRQWPTGFNPARIRKAAGLLLVFPHAKTAAIGEAAYIVLTVRSETLRRHSGQVSLPGGVLEPGETFEQAALREAHEEVALPLDGIRIAGALTPLDIPVSGFRLHPIVAVANARPALAPIDGEVSRILEVAVDELLDPAAIVWLERERDGVALRVPAFAIAGYEIWGATAMVLAEFLTMLGWIPPMSI